MDPATLMLIISAVKAAIKAAPEILDVAMGAKIFIASLFKANLITAEQQREIFATVDAICNQAITDTYGDHWKVDPDPDTK